MSKVRVTGYFRSLKQTKDEKFDNSKQFYESVYTSTNHTCNRGALAVLMQLLKLHNCLLKQTLQKTVKSQDQIIKIHSMSQKVSPQQMIHGFAKIFIGQYLTKVHSYEAFQDSAVDLLAIYMVKTLKNLASNVKKILDLQGRSIPNSLHLLAVVDLKKMLDLEDVLVHIVKIREMRSEEFDVLRRYGNMVFKNDVGSVNNYQKETRYSNIQYVPAVYTYEIDQKALPYRHPIHECIRQPLPMTYKNTKKVVNMKQQKMQQLQSYHRHEMKRANSILLASKQEEKKQKKINQVVSKQKETSIIKKSASQKHLQSKPEMVKCKSTKDLGRVLPDEEEDHKIQDNDDQKSDPFEFFRPKEANKQQNDQNSAQKFTLKKAVVTLELPLITHDPACEQNATTNKNSLEPSSLIRCLSLQPKEKRSYGSSLDPCGKACASPSKKNKFELISFL